MYTPQEVAGWFTHTPGGAVDIEKAKRFKRLHDAARVFAAELVDVLPPDRHESVNSLDCLQGAVSWGNSAISRDGFASGVPVVCAGCGNGLDCCLKTAACDLARSVDNDPGYQDAIARRDAQTPPIGTPVGTKKKDSAISAS